MQQQQQQQQIVEEQASIEQMQTEEKPSAFCAKLNQERPFRKSMVIILLSKNILFFLFQLLKMFLFFLFFHVLMCIDGIQCETCSGTIGQSVRRIMRAIGTNMLRSKYSLRKKREESVSGPSRHATYHK